MPGDKISVCLLTYNHAHVIESTVESILNQTASGYELILSDDCSTDGTWEIIQDIAQRHPQARALRTSRNMGMPGNANFAVATSTRPHIALLHHDDIYRSDLLEKWSASLDQYPQAQFVFNSYFNESDGRISSNESFLKELNDGDKFLNDMLWAHWGCVVRGTAMIRRSAWERLGGMREEFELLADVDMWMRLSRLGPVAYVPEPLITVRARRPNYYPDIYTGKNWSWKRQVLLYRIHANNLLDYLRLDSISGRLRWWMFRLHLNAETAKWLMYAVLRNKHSIIADSSASATPFDFPPLQVMRTALKMLFRQNAASKEISG